MFKLETPKGTIAIAEGAVGLIERQPHEVVHFKNRKGQDWCLCCKGRAPIWVDSKYSHKRHPQGCSPIGHWPKGED